MPIFQKSVIKKHLRGINKIWLNKAYDKFKDIFTEKKIQTIIKLKEEEYQDGFLRDIFVEILGYKIKPDDNFNLVREFKNQTDGKKADGAIIKNEKAIAVIELKSTKTKDLTSITQQAFNYKHNQPGCKYVVTSNFQKLRFYIDYSNEYEEFDIFNMQKNEFKLMYLILRKDAIFNDLPYKLKEETRFHEKNISEQLYKDYSNFKNKIFENIVKRNPEIDKLTLFKKSQKLLDRLLFIFFAEDCGLLPANSISRIIERYEQLKKLDAYKPLYEIYLQYFGYMNIGRKGQITADDIPAYNGGLFEEDKLLDNLKIDDKVLKADSLKLSAYDFNTDVDVNILGHIFEHSLNEIEEIEQKINLNLQGFKSRTSKRKKDGVFYTPKYITQYIVENTIGTLCTEKRKEMNIYEIEFDNSYNTKRGKLNKKGKELFSNFNKYKKWLESLKILDPACGSGAFLNQALQFLIKEHKFIDDLTAELTKQKIRLFDTDKNILENNLYGVDINEESVDIAKLSLWLRTAQKGRKLSTLNENIKCGNSLIDDPEVAGNKAFDWNIEFKEIMENGGFDVVIGNPPWGAKLNKKNILYLNKLYPNISKTKDTYLYFIIKFNNFLKENGVFSFIIPNTWLLINSAKKFREQLLKKNITEIADYGDNVFADATVESMILTIKNNNYQNKNVQTYRFKNQLQIFDSLTKKNNWIKDEYFKINIERTDKIDTIIDNLYKLAVPFKNVAEIIWGIKPYQVGHGKPKQTREMLKNRIYHSNTKHDEKWKPLLVGSNINRYSRTTNNIQYILYGKNLMYPSNEDKILKNKILLRQTSDILRACFDDKAFYCQNSLFIITSDNINLKYLTILLNSKLLNFVYSIFNPQTGKVFAEIKPSVVKSLPIKIITNETQKTFIKKADKMLSLNKVFQTDKDNFLQTLREEKSILKLSRKLQNFHNLEFDEFKKELRKKKVKFSLGTENNEWREYFNTSKEKINKLQTQINQTDKEIDKMVYELYELTDKEIEIVEKSVK